MIARRLNGRWRAALGAGVALQLALAGAPNAQTRIAEASWPPLPPAGAAPLPPADAPPAWQPLRPAPPAPPVAGPRVILSVDNPNGRLQQHAQLRWRDVCLAPCGYTLDPRALYRVGGGTSIASAPFSLPRAAGDVYIEAEVGSKVTRFVGLGLMIGGFVAAGYGLFFWAIDSADDVSNDHFARNFAIVLFSVSGALEGVGLPMFLKGTTVQVR